MKTKDMTAFVRPKYMRDVQMWYKDSLVIEEGSAVDIEDSSGVEKVREYVGRYSFRDMRTRTVYDYASFSDTATLLKAYSDAANESGGWDIYGVKPPYPAKFAIPLLDTLIGGITYQRFANDTTYYSEGGEAETVFYIDYLRCDKKGVFFKFNKKRDSLLCPIVIRESRSRERQSIIIRELEFLSRKLTPEEEKVFAAWEKYAKEHPVKSKPK
jgi:hypothetical protein